MDWTVLKVPYFLLYVIFDQSDEQISMKCTFLWGFFGWIKIQQNIEPDCFKRSDVYESACMICHPEETKDEKDDVLIRN